VEISRTHLVIESASGAEEPRNGFGTLRRLSCSVTPGTTSKSECRNEESATLIDHGPFGGQTPTGSGSGGPVRPASARRCKTLAFRTGEPERDPAVEVDPLELNRERQRVAPRPPRIGEVLLRRVRDAAGHQKESDPARADDDRFQRQRSWPRWSSMLLDDLVRPLE
jgi:hypothetical protein